MTEKVGLQAVLEDKNFQDGLKRYISGLGQIDSRTAQVAGTTGTALGSIGVALLTGMAGIGIIMSQIVPKLVSGLQQAISVVADVSKEAIMAAARVQEMGIVVDYLGTQAGYTSAQLEGYVAQLRDAGLMTSTAQGAVAEFTRYNLDLTKAYQLLRIAQGTAILADQESSENMQALIDATLTENTLMLRRRKIYVDFSNVMDDYAKAHGKAADDLTQTERAQASLDAIIAAGTPLIGLYDKAMESASKQLRSMPRYIDDLLVAAGMPFQDVFKDAVFLLVDFVKGLTDAAREGGWLNTVLSELGSTVQTLTAPLVGWGRTVIDVMKDVNLVFGSFRGPNLQALSGNIAAIQRRISELQPPDLSTPWKKQADEIIKINNELGSSIQRIWDDVGRAVAQATEDYNRQRARSDDDWIRSRERALADHRDSIAEMYEDLEDRITEMQRDRAKDRARALETHEEDMEDLRRDAGMAETKEEYDLIQELMRRKEAQFAEEQAEAENEFQAELNEERRRVKERVAIAQLEFDQRRTREDEDRRIRLAREEEDFQLRLTRQNEEASRREADLKAAAAERTALLQAEIASGQTTRQAGYDAERAALLEQLAAAKREYEKALFELPFLHEEAAKESAKAYSRLSDLFAEQLGIEFPEIQKAWEAKDWGSLGWTALMAIWKFDWNTRTAVQTAIYQWVGEQVLTYVRSLYDKNAAIAAAWVYIAKYGIGQAINAVREKIGDFWDAGWKAIEGFVKGFLWGAGWARDVVRDVITGAVRAALDALGIGSPSKVFLGIGENISASLAEGIRSMGQLPAFEMQRVAAGTMHSVTNSVSNQNFYNLSVHTSAPVEPILSDYHMLQTIAGR